MNEESRFRSVFCITRERYMEFTKLNTECHFRNTLLLALPALCMAYLIFMLRYGTSAVTVLFLSILWLGILLWRLLRNRDGGLEYKRLLHANGGCVPCRKISITGSGILEPSEGTGKDILTSFDSVRFLMESENLLVVVTTLKLAHVFDKTTLEAGTRDDLVACLRQNCPRLQKRIRTGILGRIVQWVLLGITVLALIVSLAVLLDIPAKLSGRMTNSMSYQEMARELEAFDIHISDQAIAEIKAFDAEYALENGDYYDDNPYASKVYDLLCWEGTGSYSESDYSWTPSVSGVYWLDMEVMFVDRIYSDFFAGVSAMAPELNITDVTEDYSGVDWENGTGEVTVTFCLDGTTHTMKLSMMQDWIDLNVLYDLAKLLEQDQDPRSLWRCPDGQGILLYYGTEEQVQALSKKTGLDFHESIQLNCDH